MPQPTGGWPQPHDQLDRTWTEAPILLDHVSHRFGEHLAVDDITLRVDRGRLLGIIGPSGAGKTTAIRAVTGGLAPTDGTVRVLGEDPRRFTRRTRERIGYMPQLFVLYPDLTARENVDFVAALFGISPWRRGEKVQRVLELVELWDARDRRARGRGGGSSDRPPTACWSSPRTPAWRACRHPPASDQGIGAIQVYR